MHSGGTPRGTHKFSSQDNEPVLYGRHSWGPRGQITIDQARRTFPTLGHTSLPCSSPTEPECSPQGKESTVRTLRRAELGTGEALVG